MNAFLELPVLLINLEKDKLRKENTLSILKSLGINSTRIHTIKAIEGANLNEMNLIQNNIITPGYSSYSKLSNLNMAACGLSHNLAYKFIINENLPAALVFEDDIFLTKSIKKSTNIFNQIYHKELPKNFDILFLERCLDNKKLQKRYSPHLFIPDAPQCSAARLISLNGARKLLTITQPFYGPHDKMIADSIHQHSLRAFASNPMLFGQDGRYESNIGDYPGQQNLKKPFLSKRSPEYYCPKKHNIIYRWWKVTETKLKKIKPLKILVKKIKDLC